MGTSTSKPLSSQPGTMPQQQFLNSTLKDTTFRSVVFGKKDVEVVPNAEGQMILKDQVDETLFNSYVHFLKIMAQLSRLVYCDSGIIREVVISSEFGSQDNKAVNNKITQTDNAFLAMRIQPSTEPNSKEGRPMVSYIHPKSSNIGDGIVTYVSSPSDLTFMLMKGTHLANKHSSFRDTDLILVFKGSSTIKNFKHDLYSQFTPTEFSRLMPPGTSATSTDIGNVPASFINPLNKSWNILSEQIKKHNPTRLFITGHSLGGAYASLFAFMVCEIRSSFPSVQSVHLVSFGCPTILADKARNSFNKHLDSGFITLDRVVSTGYISKIMDAIPLIPAGYSHPGFQPLRTELYPEKKTGRAYNLENIRKVYQKGGVLGYGPEKTKYELETKTHMPNKVGIPAYTPQGNGFAHSEYFDMTWFNAFRWLGMKNPGFTGNTFVAQLHEDGISFNYIGSDPTEPVAEEPTEGKQSMASLAKGGRSKTYRGKKRNKRGTVKNK